MHYVGMINVIPNVNILILAASLWNPSKFRAFFHVHCTEESAVKHMFAYLYLEQQVSKIRHPGKDLMNIVNGWLSSSIHTSSFCGTLLPNSNFR